MKTICYIILLVLIISLMACHGDENIDRFEAGSPKQDLEVLEDWIIFYEDLVEENYPSNDPRELLLDISNDLVSGLNINQERLCRLINRYDSSTLEAKYQRHDYDTVYATNLEDINPSVAEIYSVTKDGDTIEALTMLAPNKTVESLVEEEKINGYTELISEGSFILGLEKVRDRKDIEGKLEVYEQVGKIPPKLAAKNIAHNQSIDHEDYFIKRIIVVDILYLYWRSYACN